MMAMHRLQDGPSANSKTESARMKEELAEYKREAEDVSTVATLDPPPCQVIMAKRAC